MPSSTVYETLDSVKAHSDRLKASVANPVPLTAGTDLFQQYLVSSLKSQDGTSFESVRQHLLKNGRLFASRAVAARNGIAEAGWRFVSEGKCVLTHGASRAVTGLLERAAKELGEGKFRVVYVRDDARAKESDAVVKDLRAKGIPVAEIHEAAIAHVMGLLRQVNMVIVGAEAVTQNGGIISRLGTFQIAQLAARAKIPFFVAAETHKFVRKFPLDQRDLGFEQKVLDFKLEGQSQQPVDAVDYTVSYRFYTKTRTRRQTLIFGSRPSSSSTSSQKTAPTCPPTSLSSCSTSTAASTVKPTVTRKYKDSVYNEQ